MRIYSQDKKQRICGHYTPNEEPNKPGELCGKTATHACCTHNFHLVDRCEEHSRVFSHTSLIKTSS